MSFKPLLAVTVLLAGIGATPATAAKRDFETCDNLRAPGDGASGMGAALSTSGFNFGASVAALPDGAPVLIAACTAALADPRLLPAQALRRSHLLRARAVAQLQKGDPDAALADVDAALAAAGPLAADPLFARSMGGSFELIRAAAHQAKGDRAEARRWVAAAAARRPYSVTIQSLAAIIAQKSRDPAAPAPAAYLPLIPLIPDAVKLQFISDIEAGRFADAAALHPRLKLAPPAGLGFNVNALVEPIVVAANAGYAFAATGRPARATAIMAEAKAALETLLAPPPPDPKGKPVLGVGAMIGDPLRAFYARNAKLVEARIAVAEQRPLDALKLLVGSELPVSASSVELLTALRAALPADTRALAPDPAQLETRLAEQRRKDTLDTAALRKGLAAPETQRTMADYEKSTGNFLRSLFVGGAKSDGFKDKTDDKTGITTVQFVGNSGSAPTVEELTLLRAAELAKAAGKPGLIIVARRDYTRTLNMTRGYSAIPISSTPAGFQTELDVRFVDPAALPPELASERDRVLDAARIYATLAPVYIPPVARSAK
ncbi:MAG: hypothetical protein V4659_08570 [Pseudomonadota bacterium]